MSVNRASEWHIKTPKNAITGKAIRKSRYRLSLTGANILAVSENLAYISYPGIAFRLPTR